MDILGLVVHLVVILEGKDVATLPCSSVLHVSYKAHNKGETTLKE